MKTYIVLLRGINVGGHKKVPMAELKALLSNNKFYDVKTYIQSGNVVLKSNEQAPKTIEKQIEVLLKTHFGFEVPAIVKTPLELLAIYEACPFSQDIKADSYFVILNNIPKPEDVQIALQKSYDNEVFEIINDALYFHSALGYGKSKFNMNWFEKTLAVKATSRNNKTMLKLLAMSEVT